MRRLGKAGNIRGDCGNQIRAGVVDAAGTDFPETEQSYFRPAEKSSGRLTGRRTACNPEGAGTRKGRFPLNFWRHWVILS